MRLNYLDIRKSFRQNRLHVFLHVFEVLKYVQSTNASNLLYEIYVTIVYKYLRGSQLLIH